MSDKHNRFGSVLKKIKKSIVLEPVKSKSKKMRQLHDLIDQVCHMGESSKKRDQIYFLFFAVNVLHATILLR